ncbi:unnamed protein product, partial [marine sediment metagenome]
DFSMFGLFIDEAISDRGTKEYMCRSPTMLRDPKTNPPRPFRDHFHGRFRDP